MTTTDLHVINHHDDIVCKCPKQRSHGDTTHTKRCPLNALEIAECPTCQRTVSITSVMDKVANAIERAQGRTRIDHSTHSHPNTPTARADCRKAFRVAGIDEAANDAELRRIRADKKKRQAATDRRLAAEAKIIIGEKNKARRASKKEG